MFIVATQICNNNIHQKTQLMRQTVAYSLPKSHDAKQLTDTKTYLISAFVMSLALNATLLNAIHHLSFCTLERNYLQAYFERVQRITLTVSSAFKHTVNLGKHVAVIVGGG